jgi:hypothetical protein
MRFPYQRPGSAPPHGEARTQPGAPGRPSPEKGTPAAPLSLADSVPRNVFGVRASFRRAVLRRSLINPRC